MTARVEKEPAASATHSAVASRLSNKYVKRFLTDLCMASYITLLGVPTAASSRLYLYNTELVSTAGVACSYSSRHETILWLAFYCCI